MVVPAYNEEKAIGRVLEDHLVEIRKIEGRIKDWELLCINDASTDGTWEVLTRIAAANPKVRILRHETNQGIAASFERLYHESRGTHIYLTGGDDQWPVENLSILFGHMQSTGSDLVIGVRQNRQKVYTLWRRILSYAFNIIPKMLYGIDTQDANGIKIGRRDIFVAPVKSRSFFGEVERIVIAHRQGKKITTVPILFKERPSGKAKGASWKYVWATWCDFLKFTVSGR